MLQRTFMMIPFQMWFALRRVDLEPARVRAGTETNQCMEELRPDLIGPIEPCPVTISG
jgi:hypothetical protein